MIAAQRVAEAVCCMVNETPKGGDPPKCSSGDGTPCGFTICKRREFAAAA
jgi:hypothetical protein